MYPYIYIYTCTYCLLPTGYSPYEECVKLGGPDESNDPAHFENRLLMDVGEMVGFGFADIRQAELDKHAMQLKQ